MDRIIINGKEYADPSEIPPELRGAYQDALELLRGPEADAVGSVTDAEPRPPRILFRGKEYSDPSEMPPEARAVFEHLELGRPPDRREGGMADRVVQVVDAPQRVAEVGEPGEPGEPVERIEIRTETVVQDLRSPRWYDMERGPIWPDLIVLALAGAFFVFLWLVS